MYDLFLVNGLCPDFSDNQMKKLNVGIKDGKIVSDQSKEEWQKTRTRQT